MDKATLTTTLGWILLFPFIGTLFITLARRSLSRTALGWIGSLMVAASFVVTLISMNQLPAGEALRQPLFTWAATDAFQLDVSLFADSLTIWWLLIVTGVGFLIHVYSIGYMAQDEGFARFFAKLNYFILAMSLLVLAENFVVLLFGWANVGFASFLLIGFWNRKPEALAAARKAFLINVVGELGMVIALALMYREFGSFDFETVFGGASAAAGGVVTAIALLLLVGVVAKSAQFPLHTWLPDAMQGPTPVSALIHAATMVTAGVYLVIRAFPLYVASPAAMETLTVIGAISALFGAIVATRQFDIKRVLAFSTMSQLGYMMLGAGVGAYAASAFHFFTHAFFKALLFLGAGIITHYLHGEQDLRKMGGLGRKLPFAYWTFLVGVLAIAGAPGFAGFFSKDEILGALLDQGRVGLWVVGVITAGLTAYYMARLFALIFAGEASEETQGDAEHSGGGLMGVPVAILAILSVVAGWMAIPGINNVPGEMLGPVFERYGVHSVHAASWSWPVAVILAVAAAGFVLALTLFGPKGSARARATAEPRRVYRGLVAKAFYIDEMFLGATSAVWSFSKEALLRFQSGYLRRYALTLVAGFAAFVFYFLMV